MPADYLSRLPSLPINAIASQHTNAAFAPFMPDLQMLQHQDQDLQAIFQFLKNTLQISKLESTIEPRNRKQICLQTSFASMISTFTSWMT